MDVPVFYCYNFADSPSTKQVNKLRRISNSHKLKLAYNISKPVKTLHWVIPFYIRTLPSVEEL